MSAGGSGTRGPWTSSRSGLAARIALRLSGRGGGRLAGAAAVLLARRFIAAEDLAARGKAVSPVQRRLVTAAASTALAPCLAPGLRVCQYEPYTQ